MRMRADRKRESRAVNGARSVDSKVQFAFFTTVGQIRSRPQVSGRGIHPSRRASTDPSSAMSRVTNATVFAVAAALPQCISDRRFQDCNDDNNSDRKKCSGQCRRPPARPRSVPSSVRISQCDLPSASNDPAPLSNNGQSKPRTPRTDGQQHCIP